MHNEHIKRIAEKAVFLIDERLTRHGVKSRHLSELHRHGDTVEGRPLATLHVDWSGKEDELHFAIDSLLANVARAAMHTDLIFADLAVPPTQVSGALSASDVSSARYVIGSLSNGVLAHRIDVLFG